MSATAKKWTLAAGTVATALVLAEIVLRLTGYGAVAPELGFGVNARRGLEQGSLVPHAELFWTLPAAATDLDRALNAVHPDRPLPPRDGRTRVLVLGDSCSRLSVRGLPYSAALQSRLGAGYEVLNASVPGYSSHQGLAWLRLQLLDARPDVTIIYFGWNDHWRATGRTDRDLARRQAPSRLRLLNLLDRPQAPAPLRVPEAHYRENLAAMVDALTAAGGRVVLIAAPSQLTPEARAHLVRTGYLRPDDDPRALHARYLEVVRSFAGREGVDVFAADGLLLDIDVGTPLIHRDGIHPTDEAHAALGAALALLVRDGEGAGGTVTPAMIRQARAAAAGARP